MLGLLMMFAHRAFEQHALDDLFDRETPTVALHSENIRGWLGRYRTLAPTYAHYSEIIDLLKNPDDPARIVQY